ncbi:MAG: hypothetical protein ACI841_003062 [Planctomycetota bacterium]|jgi:hypothetical protein
MTQDSDLTRQITNPVGRGLRIALILYAAVCASALVWPVYPMVMERVPKLIFGLPSGLVWSLTWVATTFAVLCLFHLRYQGALDAAACEGGAE